MPQLELGFLPLKASEVREGMNVAFILDRRVAKRRKERVVCLGRVVSLFNGSAVIEELSAPGSRYNRALDQLFEVHADTTLEKWRA